MRYKQKEYNDAISAFTTALGFAGRDDLLELLDQRAATFIKLENYNSALKDGRMMIQSFKTDVKVLRAPDLMVVKSANLDRAICEPQTF